MNWTGPVLAAAYAAVALASMGASAAGDPARRDPADAKAQVVALQYVSAFNDYRKFADEPVAPWRAANELARRLGGWKAFAGGQEPDLPDAPPAAAGENRPIEPGTPPPAGGHAGHTAK